MVQKIILYFRWMRSLKVSTASQAKQRRIANEWSGEDFTVEDAPFLFEDKAKKRKFRHCQSTLGSC